VHLILPPVATSESTTEATVDLKPANLVMDVGTLV
jgi:hypothetical protein